MDKLLVKGINSEKHAFAGPKIVQIDLTGKCNNSCIGCWVHSPYIKNPPRDKNAVLSFERISRLIDNLAQLGTREIFLSGAGEPFLHPEVFRIIEAIKAKGLKLNIITNFSLINRRNAEKLVDLKVDMITASIWGGDEDTYIKTHPGKSANDFAAIRNNIKTLSQIKNKNNVFFPHVKIFNVICNLNCNNIHSMIDFALEAEAESIEFQIMDIVEGSTDFLRLSSDDINIIKQQFCTLFERNDLFFRDINEYNAENSRSQELFEFSGRFIKIPVGFRLEEKIECTEGKNICLRSLICPSGFTSLPSESNPLVKEDCNKIIFKRSKEECMNCRHFKTDCPVNRDFDIPFKYLQVLGHYPFMRRINSADIYKKEYERDFIDKLPCYIGWIYSRVISTGDVIPCCKAINKPLGNINKEYFKEIWDSQDYQEFRFNAKNLSKADGYFNEIDCFKSCDNVGMNIQIIDNLSKINLEKDHGCKLEAVYNGAKLYKKLPQAEQQIIVMANSFHNGNLNKYTDEFGKGVVIDGGFKYGYAEYEVDFTNSGIYELWLCYASNEKRGLKIYIDGQLVKDKAADYITGGWDKSHLIWSKELKISNIKGKHYIKFASNNVFPHIHSFVFLSNVKREDSDLIECGCEQIYDGKFPFGVLREKIKRNGIIIAFRSLAKYILSGKFLNSYLDILGIFNGSYAFKGPFHVQIDLTYRCNNDCIGCWCNSPLLGEKRITNEKKNETLPYPLVIDLLDEISAMGVKEIYFSGGGEPFMHPNIFEILEYAKSKKLLCYINTNFTLLDKEKINKLIELGIDHLTVSTWAATAQTYAKTHPNKNEDTFNTIRENLKFLNSVKKTKPHIKLYNVIFNYNYHELKEMILFAKDTGCESVEFTVLDTIPGKTDRLLLNKEQIKELEESVIQIKAGIDSKGLYEGVLLFRFESFLRRISSREDLSNATYDRNIIDKIPCYIGWCFSRIMPNGDVNACLKAHRIPSGNLFQQNFREIWNGDKQIFFRKKTLVKEKKGEFFTLIGNDLDIKEAGCYKSCDDIGRNIYMHNRIMSLTLVERFFLKILSKIFKKPPVSKENKILKNNDLIRKGILTKRKAFVGPEQVVVDITNRCNLRCVACWLYSPVLKNPPKSDILSAELSFDRLSGLIKELAAMGTKRIRFTGGGEPFLYSRIFDAIALAKQRKLICSVTTNFTLLNKKKIDELIKLGIDELTVSLWASNEDNYRIMHPGCAQDMFKMIDDNLDMLIQNKKKKPFVTAANVISNLNYRYLEQMFDFAVKKGLDSVYFTLLDPLEGTDELLLDSGQKKDVLKQCENIKRKIKLFSSEKRIELHYFDGFISRLTQSQSRDGNYDKQRVQGVPCYAGWLFARIMADGSVSPCCRAVKKTMGNINKNCFKDIWFSRIYNEFRSKALLLDKADIYFKDIGCFKTCDNLMHNEHMHNILTYGK